MTGFRRRLKNGFAHSLEACFEIRAKPKSEGGTHIAVQANDREGASLEWLGPPEFHSNLKRVKKQAARATDQDREALSSRSAPKGRTSQPRHRHQTHFETEVPSKRGFTRLTPAGPPRTFGFLMICTVVYLVGGGVGSARREDGEGEARRRSGPEIVSVT
jgi:hypothetical protein